ncbi:biogenesis of lysosome-related organelles complex 1 subunit 2 isoform X1 [Callithrix jacchus]
MCGGGSESEIWARHLAHVYNPSIWEAEAVDHLRSEIPDQPRQHGKTLSPLKIQKLGWRGATSEDYKLLENMNKLTSLKYLEMKDIAINISRNLKDLNQKYAGLQPYLDQINVIEEQVAALEQAAYKLDAYSKKLEAKYKKLEKR